MAFPNKSINDQRHPSLSSTSVEAPGGGNAYLRSFDSSSTLFSAGPSQSSEGLVIDARPESRMNVDLVHRENSGASRNNFVRQNRAHALIASEFSQARSMSRQTTNSVVVPATVGAQAIVDPLQSHFHLPPAVSVPSPPFTTETMPELRRRYPRSIAKFLNENTSSEHWNPLQSQKEYCIPGGGRNSSHRRETLQEFLLSVDDAFGLTQVPTVPHQGNSRLFRRGDREERDPESLSGDADHREDEGFD